MDEEKERKRYVILAHGNIIFNEDDLDQAVAAMMGAMRSQEYARDTIRMYISGHLMHTVGPQRPDMPLGTG